MINDLITVLQFSGIVSVFCLVYAPILSWVLPAR